MSLILTTKYEGRERLWLFYSNRALRLFPVYWALLLIFALLALTRFDVWPLSQIAIAARNPLSLATDGTTPSLWAAIPNLTFVGSDVFRVLMVDLQSMTLVPWTRGLVEGATHRGAYQYLVAPHIWSLGVEIIFYAIAPFAVRLSTGRMILLLMALCALQFSIHWMANGRLGWFHLLAPYCLCYFVTGMVAHRVWPRVEGHVGTFARQALMVLPFLLWAFWQVIPMSGATTWVLWLLFAAALPCLFQATKNSRLDARISAYSYPVYLCHTLFTWPMLRLGEWAGIAALALSVGLSWLLIRFIDEPVEAWRQRRAARTGPAASGSRS